MSEPLGLERQVVVSCPCMLGTDLSPLGAAGALDRQAISPAYPHVMSEAGSLTEPGPHNRPDCSTIKLQEAACLLCLSAGSQTHQMWLFR